MELAGAQVLVLGAQRTGGSVATFLLARGAAVRVADRSPEARAALASGLSVTTVADDAPDVLRAVELVVTSPGVPRTHAVLAAAAERGIPVWSEIELAGRFLSCPVLAVTGTNGKSTTTTLLGAMCTEAGIATFVGGNLGTPLIDAALMETMPELAVAEVSSFQLEWVDTFHPRVAVMLNLTPDHLDRYSSMEEYGAAKAALLRRCGVGDYVVLNRDDPWVWGLRDETPSSVVSFGRDAVEFGAYVDKGSIVFWGTEPHSHHFSLERTRLTGAHNEENIMAAVVAACMWGLPVEAIQRAIDRVEPLPHRLTFVRERAGVRYFDDSKGTNVGAVEKSLASFPGNVIVLLGGYDKGGDFGELAEAVRSRVRHIVAFGAAGPHVAEQLEGTVPLSVVPGLQAAVARAASVARPGDVVLLSPGCASFDEFRDYVDRGRRFREWVKAL